MKSHKTHWRNHKAKTIFDNVNPIYTTHNEVMKMIEKEEKNEKDYDSQNAQQGKTTT